MILLLLEKTNSSTKIKGINTCFDDRLGLYSYTLIIIHWLYNNNFFESYFKVKFCIIIIIEINGSPCDKNNYFIDEMGCYLNGSISKENQCRCYR